MRLNHSIDNDLDLRPPSILIPWDPTPRTRSTVHDRTPSINISGRTLAERRVDRRSPAGVAYQRYHQ